MTLTQEAIRSHVLAQGGDLNKAVRHIASLTGRDSRSVRDVIITTMGWNQRPRQQECYGQGRSERGRHR